MPRRIALVIHSLAGGGAERVVSLLASHWAAQGVEVALITLDSPQNDAYPLGVGVHRVGLGLMGDSRSLWDAIVNNVVRLRRLRRVIKQSQAPIAISFTDKMNVMTLIACWGLRIGIVVCERTDPRYHKIGGVWAWLRKRFYPRCRGLVVQTDAVREWARSIAGGRPVYVIPNAARRPQEGTKPVRGSVEDGFRVVALGRLSREKGYDLLISAFSQVAGRFSSWRLQIYGDGDARPELEQLCQQLGLEDRVQLLGWISRPDDVLYGADLFVLPSRYEGFPNALLEAMACGLACVSFDCNSGPREIIRHDVDGILVPAENVDALAQAMAAAMSDDALRRRLGENARQVTERFCVRLFFRRWDAVVEGIAEKEFDDLSYDEAEGAG
jgi:glycosyltransferase involved in cell wall biosynthesis